MRFGFFKSRQVVDSTGLTEPLLKEPFLEVGRVLVRPNAKLSNPIQDPEGAKLFARTVSIKGDNNMGTRPLAGVPFAPRAKSADDPPPLKLGVPAV